jgi:16S rRNA (uracil1498-N3)-methyltransferase
VIVADLDAPVLSDDDARHLGAVLRIRAGEAVTVTDGLGRFRLCHYGPGGTLEPGGEVSEVERAAPLVTVAFAPVKGDRPEWAVQKLTEVGVDRMVLMHTDRCVVRWDERRADSHLDRLRKVARQAVMQSRRCWVPEVTGMVDFSVVAGGPGVALATPGGRPPDLDHPTVLIGPEGGWSPEEEGRGLAEVVLGTGILRAETAAVAAGVLLASLRAGIVHGGAG